MSAIDVSRFHRIVPDPARLSACAVTVMPDRTVRLTDRLNRSLGTQIALLLDASDDGRELLLRQVERGTETSFSLPKSGIFRSKRLCDELEKQVRLPARYLAEWVEEDGLWLCTQDEDYPGPTQKPTAKRLRTPRKTHLSAMLPQKGGQ